MCNYCLYRYQVLCDLVHTKELLNKASCSHCILNICKNIKIVSEKTCFQKSFEFFKNISFIKKNVGRASKTETSQENLTSIWELHEIIWEINFATLVLALHCYSGDNKQNRNFFQITCFTERKNIAVEKDLRVLRNSYKKLCLPVITWNEKYLSKQVAPITYALEKMFFCSGYFWMFVSRFVSDRLKKM